MDDRRTDAEMRVDVPNGYDQGDKCRRYVQMMIAGSQGRAAAHCACC